MLSPQLVAAIRPQQRMAVFLWLAMVSSVLVYAGVLYLLESQGSLAALAERNPGLKDAFHLLRFLESPLVLVLAAASILLGLWQRLSTARMHKVLRRSWTAEALAMPRQGPVDPGRLAQLQALPPDDLRLYALLPLYLTGMVLRLALAEAIAVIGFVLAYLGTDPALLMPYAGLALLLMFTAFPRMTACVERGARERQRLGIG